MDATTAIWVETLETVGMADEDATTEAAAEETTAAELVAATEVVATAVLVELDDVLLSEGQTAGPGKV